MEARSLKRTIAQLAQHAMMAMAVSLVFVIFMDAVFIPVSLQAWYLPFVWGPGLILGFLANRRMLQSTACFVWMPGLIWLVLGTFDQTFHRPNWASWIVAVKEGMFPVSQNGCGTTECLGVLVYTMPAVNSVAYSLGAWLALRSTRKKDNGGPA